MKTLSFFFIGLVVTAAQGASDKKWVELGKIQSLSLSRAKTVEATIPLTVIKGFHIQANPASNPQLIATTLDVAAADGVEVGKPAYPPGKVYRLAATNTEVMTYDGKVSITVPVTAGQDAKPGKHELVGKLRYQACNDKTCFFPTTIEVKIPVNVTQ